MLTQQDNELVLLVKEFLARRATIGQLREFIRQVEKGEATNSSGEINQLIFFEGWTIDLFVTEYGNLGMTIEEGDQFPVDLSVSKRDHKKITVS